MVRSDPEGHRRTRSQADPPHPRFKASLMHVISIIDAVGTELLHCVFTPVLISAKSGCRTTGQGFKYSSGPPHAEPWVSGPLPTLQRLTRLATYFWERALKKLTRHASTSCPVSA